MSYSQKGYGSAGRVARKSDKDITSLQEVRARQIVSPSVPTNATARSTQAASAAGIPGYYSSQRGPAVTKSVYRKLAALGAAQGGFGEDGQTDTDARKTAFYQAQGLKIGNDPAEGEITLANADQAAMLKWADRKQLQGFGVKLERDDVEFLEQKRAEELQFRFDEWLARRIDLNDPANSRWVQEVVPDFFERREKFIDDKINLEAALAKIRLRGANSKKDLQLLFAINSGLITPSQKVLFGSTPLAAGTDYQPGMMSVLQWFAPRSTAPVWGTSTTDPFDSPSSIVGSGGGLL